MMPAAFAGVAKASLLDSYLHMYIWCTVLRQRHWPGRNKPRFLHVVMHTTFWGDFGAFTTKKSAPFSTHYYLHHTHWSNGPENPARVFRLSDRSA